jgi:hypothetical protein
MMDLKTLYENNLITVEQLTRLVRLGTLGNPAGIKISDFEYITGKSIGELVSLEDAKAIQHGAFNARRELERREVTATYDNDEFDIDRTAQINITAIAMRASMMIAAGEEGTFVYRSATNTDHTFTPQQIMELSGVIMAKITELYTKSWESKKRIDEATTVEEVFSIEIV